MADTTVTAASVKSGADAVTVSRWKSGEAITQGQPVYLDSTTGKVYVAQAAAAGAAAVARAVGFAITEATGADQPIVYQSSGLIAGLGHTIGLVYILSGTKGGISPHTDTTTPATTELLTVLGTGYDATWFNIGIVYGGRLA